MNQRPRLYWDDEMLRYDFGPSHPMTPIRLDLTMRLAREMGVVDLLDVVSPTPATDADLSRVHSSEFISAVHRASEPGAEGDLMHGLGTPDVPVFEDMHNVSALIAGGTLNAARAVWTGLSPRAFCPAGGLHHAMPDAAGGFCVYNDLAVAIAALLDDGVERIAYLDLDVHHGDGVQAAFWNDPRVLTISLHQHPHTLYPGTGWPDEVGGPDAEGFAVNVALPPGITDDGWLRALHAVAAPLLRAFTPQVVVSQHGCDSHLVDPLASMALSIDGQREGAVSVHRWATDLCEGRWIATGGGGYEVVDVVPRIWTHVMAEVAGEPIPPRTAVPPSWREVVEARFGRVAPLRMTDGVEPMVEGWRPENSSTSDAVDRAIRATRNEAFPRHGLDPERD